MYIPELASMFLFKPVSLSQYFLLKSLKNLSIAAKVASTEKINMRLNFITFTALNRLTK
jgi:hypothetical protein